MLQPSVVGLDQAKVCLQRLQFAAPLGNSFQFAGDAGVQDAEICIDLCQPRMICIDLCQPRIKVATLTQEGEHGVHDDEQRQREDGGENDLGTENNLEDFASL